MVLVVKLAQHHDAFGALVAGEEVEVEQHHLSFEVGEVAGDTLVVLQGEIDATVDANLAGVNLLLGSLILHDANVLHALDGDVVQVLATLGIRIISVPTRSYGCKDFDIFLVVARIEYQRVGAS